MKKKKFVRSIPEERIKALRNTLQELSTSHGAPCGCIVCETLVYDGMAALGEINLKTGERK